MDNLTSAHFIGSAVRGSGATYSLVYWSASERFVYWRR